MARLKGLTLIPPDDLIQLRKDPKTGVVNNRDLRDALNDLSMETANICALNTGELKFKDASIAHYILMKFTQPWEDLRHELEYKEAVGWAMTVIKQDYIANGREELYQSKIVPRVRTVCEHFHMEMRDYCLDKDNLRRLKVEVERASVPPREYFGG